MTSGPANATPITHRSAVWASATGVAASFVIAVGTMWRAVVVGRGWFGQNDFLISLPSTSPTDIEYTAGFSPGSVLLAQHVATIAPLDWPTAAAIVIVVQSAALVALWHVLSVILPDRWLRLPVLTFFTVTPLTLWSTQWWTFALQFWPAALAVLIALLAVLRRTQRGWAAGPWVAAAGTATALAFNERWLLAPLVLLGIAVAVGSEARARDRLVRVALGHPSIWAAQAVVLVLYAIARALAAPPRLGALREPIGVATAYLRHLSALLPGGPWGAGTVEPALLTPPSWAVGVGLVLFLAVIALTLTHGGLDARVAWSVFAVHFLIFVGLLTAQPGESTVESLDFLHRYGADASLVLTIVVAAALRQTPSAGFAGRSARALRPAAHASEAAVSVVAALAVALSAAVSTPALSVPLLHRDSREYVDTARAALREDRTAVILDSGTPASVLSPWFADAARVSTVLAQAPENPVFDVPSHRLRLVREDGAFAPIVLFGSVDMVPTDDVVCPRAVRFAGTVVPFQRTVPMGRWVVRLGYYTADAGLAVVDVAGQRISVPVQSGLNSVDVPVTATFDELSIALEHPTSTLCLASATAGVPTYWPERSP
jgi:hypothetical protein